MFLWAPLTSLLMSKLCAGCKEARAHLNYLSLCKTCMARVESNANPCMICAYPLAKNFHLHFNLNSEEKFKRICLRCKRQRPIYQKLISPLLFCGAFADSLRQAKAGNDWHYFSAALSAFISDEEKCWQIKETLSTWPISMVSWIPSSPKKSLKRGFTPAYLLARTIQRMGYARNTNNTHDNWPVCSTENTPLLQETLRWRRRQAVEMKYLSTRIQRQKEALYRFTLVSPQKISGHHVLIVDDIATTTSTLSAASRQLLNAGAASVYGFTLARTP